ncbi:MAG: ComEC/Rec2 family competence protein [Tannerella sp.]|jgi:competence protein ComEC|nr:ComEC/Rec2 family competence protein [Tannerella sp.]
MIRPNESFVEEIQKRPFVRPLIFWIIGIVLYVYFPLQQVSLIFPAIVFVFIVVSLLLTGHTENKYDDRWVWGVVFACFTVFLAIQITALKEAGLQLPSEPGILMRKAKALQLVMVEKLDVLRLPDSDKSVLATITVNYRKAMSWETRNMFSATGISHILSVSGYHVGIVCAFIGYALSLVPNRTRIIRIVKFIITILCVWIFTFISGLDTAAVRAAVMLTIFLIANVINRYSDRYNSLAGAAFCMLVYDPFYLFDIGFQLSYIAVFFLLYLQPKLSSVLEIKNPLIKMPWDILTVTVAAQTGTLFLCFYYFGRSSAVFLFTNLIMSLLSSIIIPATLIFMLLPSWMPGINLLQFVIEHVTQYMMWIIERFASIPYATFSVKFDFPTMLLSYLSLALFFFYLQNRKYRLLIATLLVLFIILVKNML